MADSPGRGGVPLANPCLAWLPPGVDLLAGLPDYSGTAALSALGVLPSQGFPSSPRLAMLPALTTTGGGSPSAPAAAGSGSDLSAAATPPPFRRINSTPAVPVGRKRDASGSLRSPAASGTGTGGRPSKVMRRQPYSPVLPAQVVERELSQLQQRLQSASPAEVVSMLSQRLASRCSATAAVLGRLWPDTLSVRPSSLSLALDRPDQPPEDPHGAAPHGPWVCIPDEIAQNVFRRVFIEPPEELQQSAAAARLVCRAWSKQVAAACTRLVVRSVPELLLKVPTSFYNLEHFDDTNRPCYLPDDLSLFKLRSMRIGIWTAQSRALKRAERITSLDLSRCNFMDWMEAAPLLQSKRDLVDLTLTAHAGWNLSDEVAPDLQAVTSRLRSFTAGVPRLTEPGLEALELSPASLTSLRLSQCSHLGDGAVDHLAKLTRLTELRLQSARLSSAAVRVLTTRLASLRSLDLGANFFTLGDEAADALLPLRGTLSDLDVSFWNLSARGFRSLAKLESLARLTAIGCLQEDANDAAAELRPQAPRLKCLRLSGNPTLSATGLRVCEAFRSLTTLELDDCDVTDVGLRHIASAMQKLPGPPVLQKLSFKRTCHASALTNAGMKALQGITSLQDLSLAGASRVSDAGAAALNSLTLLRRLDLSQTSVGDRGLQALAAAGMQHLRSLSLRGCHKLTDTGVSALELPSLQMLVLSDCPGIGDQTLQAVALSLPRLKQLHIKGCVQVTDAGVRSLKGLACLALLDMRFCESVGHLGVVELQWMPRLRKIYLFGTAMQAISSYTLSKAVQRKAFLEEICNTASVSINSSSKDAFPSYDSDE